MAKPATPLCARLNDEPDASYSVDARTSFGRVNSELPITVTSSVTGDSISGKIGSGECELHLNECNSCIEILKANK